MREEQGKSKGEKKNLKQKEDIAPVLPQEVKNSVHFCFPPHSSHKTNFVTHCITLTATLGLFHLPA